MSEEGEGERRSGVGWNGLAAVIASMIGALALGVSAYTAYLQRMQVRAQVWPHLMLVNFDTELTIKALNKGVGPAIVRSTRVTVDGKPMRSWSEVMGALGLEKTSFRLSTISNNVIAGGEVLPILVLDEADAFQQVRMAAEQRIVVEICYCSTLNECWVTGDEATSSRWAQTQVDACPVMGAGEAFAD